MLKRIKGKNWGASSQLITITYKTLIRPIIDYIPFLTPLMSNSNYLILERIQRRAARSITYWPIKTHTSSEIYEQINLDDVISRAWKLTDNYMSKAIRNNDLIRSMVDCYNVAPQLNEGTWCKSEPRKTIIGQLINKLISIAITYFCPILIAVKPTSQISYLIKFLLYTYFYFYNFFFFS